MEVMKDVIHVVTDERSRNWNWDLTDAAFDSSRIKLVSIEEYQKYFGSDIKYPDRINVGDILMLHPYDKNTYVKLDYDLISDKFNKITHLMHLLGAKISRFEIEEFECKKRTWKADGGVSYKGIDASLKVKKENEVKQRYKKENEDESVGTRQNECDWFLAKEYAEDHNLMNDPDIREIIESRKPELKNKKQKKEIKVTMAKDLNDNLDIAFNLKAIKALSFSANYEETMEYRTLFSIIFKVEFPKEG